MKYLDKRGTEINYGDILRFVEYEEIRENKEYSPKIPFGMLVKHENKDMIYVSGLDEFHEIKNCQTENDNESQISTVEIFAPKKLYSELLTKFCN